MLVGVSAVVVGGVAVVVCARGVEETEASALEYSVVVGSVVTEEPFDSSSVLEEGAVEGSTEGSSGGLRAVVSVMRLGSSPVAGPVSSEGSAVGTVRTIGGNTEVGGCVVLITGVGAPVRVETVVKVAFSSESVADRSGVLSSGLVAFSDLSP